MKELLSGCVRGSHHRYMAVLVCLLLVMGWSASAAAQERSSVSSSGESFSGVIYEMHPASRLLIVSGRRFNLASTVRFDGLNMDAAGAMKRLSPEMTVMLYTQRSGSSVVVGISSGLH